MVDPLLVVGTAVIGLGLATMILMSLAEASLLAVTDVGVRRMADRGDRRGRAVATLKSGYDFLSVIIVANNIGLVLISAMMTVLVHYRLAGAETWQVEAWHIGAIVAIVMLAEVTPKTWGALAPEPVALFTAPILLRLMAVLAPIVTGVNAFAAVFLRLLRAPETNDEHSITPQEIQAAADISEEEGLVEPQEGEMFDSVIELGETVAREIMVPRVDIVAVPHDANAQQVVAVAVESGYSRIPVYEDTLDSVVGILYVADLLREFRAGRLEVDLRALARPPVFVPETKRVSELFRELRDQSVHIAIVLDEFGGTEGLVTIEDILEELVGEIEDEHDAPDEEILRISDTEYVVDGKARIEDLNEQLGLELPEGQYETIGGLLAGVLGHIPQVGEQLQIEHVMITVDEGADQYVGRVRIAVQDREGSDD